MSNIEQYLADILAARYGEEVRQSIHDAIEQCYEDGRAGAIDLEARADIAAETTAREALNNNLANCWKVAKMNVNYSDVTFPSASLYQSVSAAIPAVNNFTILNVRSTASGRQLFPMNAYVSNNIVYVPMYNLWSSDYTNISGTIEITYAYT